MPPPSSGGDGALSMSADERRAVAQLVEVTGTPTATALLTLRECGHDANQAAALLIASACGAAGGAKGRSAERDAHAACRHVCVMSARSRATPCAPQIRSPRSRARR